MSVFILSPLLEQCVSLDKEFYPYEHVFHL